MINRDCTVDHGKHMDKNQYKIPEVKDRMTMTDILMITGLSLASLAVIALQILKPVSKYPEEIRKP